MTGPEFQSFLARHGWTGYQFAKLTGIPRSNVYQWADTGVTRPADDLLLCLIDRYPNSLTEQ